MSQNPADYSIVLAATGFPRVLKAAYQLEAFLVADGTPRQAELVAAATERLKLRLRDIARETAVSAQASIRHHEVASRVRPDTHGMGGPRLGDFIGVSGPLDMVPGSVGINHEPTLENGDVGWWWTNELGYSGHIGRRFIGSFDGTRPDPTRQREHAVLDMRKGAKNRAKGTIKEPIPERRFVRDGAAHAQAAWHGKVKAAEAAFIAEIRRVAVPDPTELRLRRR